MPFTNTITKNENLIVNNYGERTFFDAQLIQSGWEVCSPGWAVGPASRSQFLFHYVLNGKGVVIILDKDGEQIKFPVKTGQGFLIFPHQSALYIADDQKPWEYLWVQCEGAKVQECFDAAGFDMQNLLYQSNDPYYHKMLIEELWYLVNNSDESFFNLIGHLYLFFDAIQRSSAARKQNQKGDLHDFYIEEAINYIQEMYHDPNLSIEEIAVQVNLSRVYFGKLFKSRIKTSPQDFLIRFRMSKACELLLNKDLMIGEIGQMVGYSDPFRFSRTFKRLYGYSPREWRFNHLKQ